MSLAPAVFLVLFCARLAMASQLIYVQGIRTGLENMGFTPAMRDLNSFQDDYGLNVSGVVANGSDDDDIDEDGEDDEEENEEDGGVEQ